MARPIDLPNWHESAERLGRFERSGTSVCASCRQEHVSELQFYGWPAGRNVLGRSPCLTLCVKGVPLSWMRPRQTLLKANHLGRGRIQAVLLRGETSLAVRTA